MRRGEMAMIKRMRLARLSVRALFALSARQCIGVLSFGMGLSFLVACGGPSSVPEAGTHSWDGRAPTGAVYVTTLSETTTATVTQILRVDPNTGEWRVLLGPSEKVGGQLISDVNGRWIAARLRRPTDDGARHVDFWLYDTSDQTSRTLPGAPGGAWVLVNGALYLSDVEGRITAIGPEPGNRMTLVPPGARETGYTWPMVDPMRPEVVFFAAVSSGTATAGGASAETVYSFDTVSRVYSVEPGVPFSRDRSDSGWVRMIVIGRRNPRETLVRSREAGPESVLLREAQVPLRGGGMPDRLACENSYTVLADFPFAEGTADAQYRCLSPDRSYVLVLQEDWRNPDGARHESNVLIVDARTGKTKRLLSTTGKTEVGDAVWAMQ